MAWKFLQKLLKPLGHGILIGIGIMGVAGVGGFVLSEVSESPVRLILQTRPSGQWVSISDAFKTDLALVSYISYKHKQNANQLVILGKIKNRASIPWYNIEIQAELFNQGEFVDECREYVKILEPDHEENFKIVCGECVGNVLPDYNKLEVRIVGAYKALY